MLFFKIFNFNKWKEKAKTRRLENKFLKQRVKELTESRDNWKKRANKAEQENEKLKKELRKKLKEGKKKEANIFQEQENIRNHSYGILIIQFLVLIKLTTSTSFRSTAKIAIILSMYFNLKRTPSHTTISLWVQKIGYYELNRKKPKANDWIIIVDESIQIGSKKLLLIVGIRESEIDFNRALRHEDVTILFEKLSFSWKAEKINEVLSELKRKLGKIKYSVSDNGIKKALKLAEIPQVYDITHHIALILKDIYEKDEDYKAFTNQMSKMRNKLFLSDVAHIIPPNQRNKCRFHNIHLISNWGKKALSYLSKGEKEEKIIEKLQWVKPFEDFITELYQINQLKEKIQEIIKQGGLSKRTVEICSSYLDKLKTQKGKIFKERLKNYFDETLKLLPDTENILCSSDIIESIFGKYKNYIAHYPVAEMTANILAISAFTTNLNENQIKQALENTKTTDITNWVKNNVGETLFKKRKETFSLQIQKWKEKKFKMAA